MVLVTVKGINIDFPFQPYKCQFNYMEKVIICLQEKKNGILESPTGTGKTLSLLCAALAWREAYVASLQLNSQVTTNELKKEWSETLDLAVGHGISSSNQAVPTIIYTSRTHSQLSQAINELKNTSYKPKICVLGSRDQMCINHDVLKLDGSTAKVFACKSKITTRSCMFFNNLEANRENTDFKKEILDIEDMGKLGNKHKVCPYFMSRELKTKADLIFMPYNYVLDFKSRQAHGIDLSNAIVLLDEAHNIESVCEEAASFELSASDLAHAQADCNECHELLKQENEMPMEGEEDSKSMAGPELTPEDAVHLKSVFKNIENIIAEPILQDGKFHTDANFLFKNLREQRIDASTVSKILEAIDRCNILLAIKGQGISKGKHFAMKKIADILRIIFCRSGGPLDFNYETARFYKVFIRHDEIKVQRSSDFEKGKERIKSNKNGRSLSYWCFHAGLAMKDLIKQGVRSLILTSGTLSPLDSFTSELDVPFPVQLQNPHVITSKQIWAGIITKGPDGTELNSSFKNRDTPEYKKSLGNLLVNLSRTTPHGLLVFFPSYPVMDRCIKFWHEEEILARITQHKPHFIEPKNKRELVLQMELFYDKIKDLSYKGATFFAVCRGKVSEGLDFANENGRVVVVTGLPFPPRMDPRVELKMKFLDDSKTLLKGRQWYRQQASRAVNQAVGRVIRHNKDYGAILLCDVRFTYRDAIDQLPIWIKPHVRQFDEFGAAQRSLVMFFRAVQNLYSPPAKKRTRTSTAVEATSMQQYPTTSARYTFKQISHQRTDTSDEKYLLVGNSSAKNSLAALKAEEKPLINSGLLASLASSKQKTENIVACTSKPMSATIFDATNEIPLDCGSKVKSKKFKIVSRKHVEVNEKEHKNDRVIHQLESSGKETNGEIKNRTHDDGFNKNKTYCPKDFMGILKKVLSSEDFKKFGKILMNYKKNNNVKYLIESLTLFFKDKKDHIYLFEGFGNFIKKDHDKVAFNEAYKKLVQNVATEESCSSGSEPATKKQKISSTQSSSTASSEEITTHHSDFFPTLSDDDDIEDEEIMGAKCVACAKQAVAPHQATCGHIACFQCWLRQFKEQKCCPKCKITLRLRKLRKMYMNDTDNK